MRHYNQGQLRIAGQHAVFPVVRRGDVARVDTIDPGFPDGLEGESSPFVAEYRSPLAVGDVAVPRIDGITEAERPEGALFGLDRRRRLLAEHWTASAASSGAP